MRLIYFYENGETQSVYGKSEKDCVRKMKNIDSKIIRVERQRSMMEKATR